MWCWLFLLLIVASPTFAQYDGRVVCYYRADNVYRGEGYRMQPQEVDPEICTHVIYYSAFLHPRDGIVPSDPNIDLTKGGYKRIVKLKRLNPDLKVMLSLRGEPGEKDLWPHIAARKSTRVWFSALVVDFLLAHNFDGLDIDWQLQCSSKNSHQYIDLLKDLRRQMELDTLEYDLPRLELSVLLPAQIQQLHRHFLLANVSREVDFINVATMDYWSLDPYTVQHHSPLYKNATEHSLSPLNVDESIKYYLFKCVPPEKLVIGIPTYGRSFKLADDRSYRLGSYCKYPGEKGFATNSPGTLAYFEICTYITEECWTVENTNLTSMGPYAYHGNRWVGYDNVRMVSIKAKYVRDRGLGGLMFWSVDQDDFRGYCHYKYALIRTGRFTLFTGVLLEDPQMLRREERLWLENRNFGYVYPKPTIQQPGFTAHEVTFTSSTTPVNIPDFGVPLINHNTSWSYTKPTTVEPPPVKHTTRKKHPTTVEPSTVQHTTRKIPPTTPSTTSKPTSTTEASTRKTYTTSKPLSSSTTTQPKTTSTTVPTTPPRAGISTTMPATDQTINVQNSPSQGPSFTSFKPAMPEQFNLTSEENIPNVALTQLYRVIHTVNSLISTANNVSSASSNQGGVPGNFTIDPSFLNILPPLLGIRNSAQFSIDRSGADTTPANSTVRLDTMVNKAPNGYISSPNGQVMIPLMTSPTLPVAKHNENSTVLTTLITDKSILISGRDIVNINLNVTINNNYFSNFTDGKK